MAAKAHGEESSPSSTTLYWITILGGALNCGFLSLLARRWILPSGFPCGLGRHRYSLGY
jgi:hypothetical protein